jgi:hypothetical protein
MIDVERARALRGRGDVAAAEALLADVLARTPEPDRATAWRRLLERAAKLQAEWRGAGRSGH